MQFAVSANASLTKVNPTRIASRSGASLNIQVDVLTTTLTGLRIDAAADVSALMVPILDASALTWTDADLVAAAGITFAYWPTGATPLGQAGTVRINLNATPHACFDIYLSGGTANLFAEVV